jgi:putative flippase GtrA
LRWRELVAELIRFGGVGGLTTVVYFSLLWLLTRLLSAPMWVLVTLAYLPPLVLAYVLHRSFTFRSQKGHGAAGPRFIVVQLAGLVINSLVIWLGVDVWHFNFVLVQLVAIGIQVLLTYLGQKLFAFS